MKIRATEPQNQNVISDVLFVLRDRKMYISEKKMWLLAIDILRESGYYGSSDNDTEKVSVFEENR